jgi:PAS domain S-box-containing protein
MENPCIQCDKYDAFLEQTPPQAANSKKPEDSSLLRRTLALYQQSYLKYKHLIENAPDAIFLADTETGLILEANHKATKLLGVPLDRVIGIHQSQIHPPEEAKKYAEIFREHAQMGLSSAYIVEDVVICNADGEKIPVQINASVAQLGDQKVIYSIFRDVTEQKLLQQQLADSERQYKDLYRNAKAALYRTRLSDGKLLECSAALADLRGYDSIEECLASHSSTDHYVDKDRRQQLLDKLQKNKRVENFPAQVRRKDKSTMWISISAEIFPEQGYLEGVLTDITASKILTEMEMKILRIILAGKSNKEIAYSLGRSIRTVEDHRAHIMQKLGVDNIVDLTRKALEQGITPDGE